jgi:ABC-type polysaccharide/polyol phosphate export permease
MDVYAAMGAYWDLFSDLFRRDLAVRFRGSLLGVAWTLINPLLLMGVYTLLFSFLIKAQGMTRSRAFPLFVLTPLLAWIFFQTRCSRRQARWSPTRRW